LENVQSDSTNDGATIRLSKVKDGYTWSLVVAADGSSIESLRELKDRVLTVSRELQAELGSEAVTDLD
jgi:hypothetical protein